MTFSNGSIDEALPAVVSTVGEQSDPNLAPACSGRDGKGGKDSARNDLRRGIALVLLLFAVTPLLPAWASADEAGPGDASFDLAGSWLDDVRLSGHVAVELRGFLESPQLDAQETGHGTSLVLDPEIYREWKGGDRSLTFEPFLRLDSVDTERTHFDIRELSYVHAERSWELTLGIDRVFWGVTESQHLVDIVNQTDLVENPDGEDKLGQPMVRLTSINAWGIVDLFVLPAFRERTFPGVEGRLRPGLPIDTDSPVYESAAEEWHTDWAVRWSHAVGAFDIGLSHFSGTSREPLLLPDSPTMPASLLPYYPLIDQTGLDAQATLGSWLLKTEAIHRTGFGLKTGGVESPRADYTAATYGFEYTFWSAFGAIDVGAVGEHLWDERGALATSPFQNDVFAGSRIAFNDTQSSEILGGVIYDLDNQARLYLLEASRRIGSSWVVELELRGFSGQRPLDPLAALRTDDYLQLSLQRHY